VYILIDLAIDAVELAEPQDTKRFHIAIVHGDADAKVEAVLEAKGIGRLDPEGDDHAWVEAGVVRQLAEGRVHGKWGEEFDHMLAKGAKHGWYDEGTNEIKAHVEWLDVEDELDNSKP